MHEIAEVIKELRDFYPGIHFHLYSGNAADVTERLDKGLLDFGVLIQPADISKYNYINLYEKDIWSVIMRKDSPLAQKEYIKKRRSPESSANLLAAGDFISSDREQVFRLVWGGL